MRLPYSRIGVRPTSPHINVDVDVNVDVDECRQKQGDRRRERSASVTSAGQEAAVVSCCMTGRTGVPRTGIPPVTSRLSPSVYLSPGAHTAIRDSLQGCVKLRSFDVVDFTG